jgi:hypothetical protein
MAYGIWGGRAATEVSSKGVSAVITNSIQVHSDMVGGRHIWTNALNGRIGLQNG